MVGAVLFIAVILLLFTWGNVGLRRRCIVEVGVGVVMAASAIMHFLGIGFDYGFTPFGSAFLGSVLLSTLLATGLLMIVGNIRKLLRFQV
jgi:hypothetical protein